MPKKTEIPNPRSEKFAFTSNKDVVVKKATQEQIDRVTKSLAKAVKRNEKEEE